MNRDTKIYIKALAIESELNAIDVIELLEQLELECIIRIIDIKG